MEEVKFSADQFRWLRKMFPNQIWGPSTNHETMLYYNGQQSVIEAIRGKTHGIQAIQGVPEE